MMENAWKLTERSRQGDGKKGWAGEDNAGAGGKKGGAAPMNARARGQMSSNIFNVEQPVYA